ncbi:PadR family transcriptional regulator [Nocardioides litoris]|uniref:PadR family transcriptional regulator n=1 Tax=Nocardioides litoris TaxID=1926648 RepID=UPI001476A88E|nr:PadR family transcriptional regulator [Nocardioides litoris]
MGPGGPPPWVAELFGIARPERGRGPRVRRGDVRFAILDVLAQAPAEEPLNGYQVIQQITERSGGAWRPSPGSVYPTLQLLTDEGLVEESADERGRRPLRLTDAGRAYLAEHGEEVAGVWTPFAAVPDRAEKEGRSGRSDLKAELNQVMPAVWQIVSQGSDAQRRAALDILADARRRLYGVLADGPDGPDADDPDVDRDA